MSTQLILYPQNYDGFNDISLPVFNEYIVNGINFFGFVAPPAGVPLHSTTAGYPSEDAIINAPPLIVNTWYRYVTSGGPWGTVAPPIATSPNLLLFFNGITNGHTGIYQKMSSLTVGLDYDITITISLPAASGIVALEIWTGTTLQSNFLFGSNVSQITATFTANSPNDIFLLDYEGTAAILYIADISITESSQNPSGVFTELQDGQVICDLYQEEDIPLTLSVDDFKNVAEKVQSYSKDFNLPATKRNNKIFDSIFDVIRTDTGFNFNPYVKTKSVLKQDGYILFEGYLRLTDIKDDNGEISYDVNLYSEVVALADILKDKTFANLDFSELEHDYDKANIKASWVNTTGITLTTPLTSTNSYAYSSIVGNLTNTNVLKYPFVDWTGNIRLANNPGAPPASGPYDNMPELTSLEQAFRPFIKVHYIINKIFADTPFTYSSEFFDALPFDRYFMDFNWGSNEFGTEVTYGQYGGNNTSPNFLSTTSFAALPLDYITFDSAMGWDSANSRFVATYDSQPYLMEIPHFGPHFYSTQTLDTRWAQYNAGGVLINTYNVASQSVPIGLLSPALTTPLTTMILDAGDYIQFEWKTNTAGQGLLGQGQLLAILGTTNDLVMTSNTVLQTLRGELGQWDFLKGIMTMFNLITMPDPDNPNNILIETYSNVFINNTNCSTTTGGVTLACRSIQHDWTDKVDVSEMQLTPLSDLNKHTIFKYAEDEDDYAFNVYKKATSGFLYGSKEYDASGFTILEGTDEIVAEPFAATIPKPLYSQFSDFIVPVIYSMNDDGTTEAFDNLPRIAHINALTTTLLSGGATYYIPAQNGLSSENQANYLECSHLSTIPPISGITTDLNFGECDYVNPLGPTVVDNLFNTYWLPYYNELYNANTRTMTMKVNLSPADINTFKMSDKVMIKNRVFRVNRIDYKPNDLATVEFILIP